MDLIKDVWIRQERAQAGFRAEIDRPAAIFEPRKIGRIGVAEFSPTEGNETRVFLWFRRLFRHLKIKLSEAACAKNFEPLR